MKLMQYDKMINRLLSRLRHTFEPGLSGRAECTPLPASHSLNYAFGRHGHPDIIRSARSFSNLMEHRG